MKIRLSELRHQIHQALVEADDDYHEKQRQAYEKLSLLKPLEGLNKPFLHGQWVSIPRNYGREGESFSSYRYATEGDCWKAEHPELGTLFLTFNSSTSYKKIGRLRDPSGTRHVYRASIGWKPFATYTPDAVTVFSKAALGEGQRVRDMENLVSAKMMKLFGVDPYAYLKPKAPAATPPVASSSQETTPAAPEVPGPQASSEKQYKIYGKKSLSRPPGVAPAHTRFKGKAYVAGQDTQFKAGDKATVSTDGGKLKVKKTDSDHTQVWEPE